MDEISLADSARKMIDEIEAAMLLRSPRRHFAVLLFDIHVPNNTGIGDVSYAVEFARWGWGGVPPLSEWALWYVEECSIGERRSATVGRLRQAPLEVQLGFLDLSPSFIEDWLELLEDQPDPHSLDRGRAALGLLAKTTYLDKDLVLRNGDGTPSELTP